MSTALGAGGNTDSFLAYRGASQPLVENQEVVTRECGVCCYRADHQGGGSTWQGHTHPSARVRVGGTVVREGFLEEELSVGVRIKEEETAEAKRLLCIIVSVVSGHTFSSSVNPVIPLNSKYYATVQTGNNIHK